MKFEILQPQAFGPILLMEVQQHRLLQFRFSVVDCNRIVVSVESMNQSLRSDKAIISQRDIE